MAVVKIPAESRVIEGVEAVGDFLASQGIEFERAKPVMTTDKRRLAALDTLQKRR